jgi:crotonobetainyl-CoA:carnitine CoA-transferase CaiB-like acyl-CoA transferase
LQIKETPVGDVSCRNRSAGLLAEDKNEVKLRSGKRPPLVKAYDGFHIPKVSTYWARASTARRRDRGDYARTGTAWSSLVLALAPVTDRGLMSITGTPDGEPQKAGVALVDVITGLFAAVGILAALRHRERTGEGQVVEVDLLSCLLAALVNQGSAYTLAGAIGSRLGNAHPSIAPYELYPTGEGDLVLAVGNDKQFGSLCRVVGLEVDPLFATNASRVENRDALRELLVTALAGRSASEWVSSMSAVGVPAGQVNDIAGAFAFADSLGLQPTITVPRADGSVARLTRNPITMSATPPTYRCAPPTLPG